MIVETASSDASFGCNPDSADNTDIYFSSIYFNDYFVLLF